jgi:ubiquinone/menaquinone biosynthesis C-methylase UbiE
VSAGKADYNEIAQVYDQARRPDMPHLEWWFARLAQAGELRQGKRLIDLGCGTGRWTIRLAERTGCEAVGLDKSEGMLEKARPKDTAGRVQWMLGDVEALELESEGFDCALMSLMMHHVADHLAAFRGVHRVLRPGGVFLIRQGTLEQILNDPMHRFFPETIGVDLARTPMRREIERWLKEAGFAEVSAELVKQMPYTCAEEAMQEFRLRVMSSLQMISDEAYYAGLNRAEEYAREHPDDEWLRSSLLTLFVARKEAETPDECR